MPTQRSQMIRRAAALPKGSDERRALLAVLAQEAAPLHDDLMDESLVPYRRLSDDFERQRLGVLDYGIGRVQYFGKTVSAGPFKHSGPLDAQKLATWLKKAKVSKLSFDPKGLYLQW